VRQRERGRLRQLGLYISATKVAVRVLELETRVLGQVGLCSSYQIIVVPTRLLSAFDGRGSTSVPLIPDQKNTAIGCSRPTYLGTPEPLVVYMVFYEKHERKI
jgi:hypothetical protein